MLEVVTPTAPFDSGVLWSKPSSGAKPRLVHRVLVLNRYNAQMTNKITSNWQPDQIHPQLLGLATGHDFGWRALGALAIFRLLIGVLLMAVFLSSTSPRFFGELYPSVFLLTLLVWFGLGVGGAIATTKRIPALDTLTEFMLFFDIAAICCLALASGGATSGVAGLLLVFIGVGSFILRLLMGLFFAALATVGLLSAQTFLNFSNQASTIDYPSAGLLSALVFAVVLAMQPLARRLAASEALARRQKVDIANLADLNRYVLQHLREAIVVVDGEDHIRLLNDAAAAYLGIERDAINEPLAQTAPALATHVALWRSQGDTPQSVDEATLPGFDGGMLQINIAPFGDQQNRAPSLLLFIEDSSVLAERVQHGKLASLGRLSASIAHEIRNPVGAMSHAAQLLAEHASDDTSQKLTNIIERNASRISEIIDDIMQMSRRDTGRPQRLKLGQWLADLTQEYIETEELEPNTIILAGEEAITEVIFDPGHLRQVVTNLLDNARRHAGISPNAPLRLNWGRVASSRRPFLEFRDQGPGIDPALEQQIFEPFFSQHDDGTGLGLYLCQELCELNRATLSYKPTQGVGATLNIVFADPGRWSGIG
ncbi:MAG: ATP-binding protein [Pseudomonadota bacterium]